MADIERGQVWEVYSAAERGWVRALVTEVYGDEVTLSPYPAADCHIPIMLQENLTDAGRCCVVENLYNGLAEVPASLW